MESPITRGALVCLWLLLACNNGTPTALREGEDAPSNERSSSSSNSSGPTPPSTMRATADAGRSARPTSDRGSPPTATDPPYRISSRALVQWKRHAAFEADLMAALELPRDKLCVEVGGKNCIRDVHLVPLGGNEPYESGLMKPSSEPLATTSSVVDRVLLSACTGRARLDAEGAPKVFTSLDFNKPLPSPSDPAIATTVRDLYRRLLARDPAPDELGRVATLAEEGEDGPVSVHDFAALSCFIIGSTAEFLFF